MNQGLRNFLIVAIILVVFVAGCAVLLTRGGGGDGGGGNGNGNGAQNGGGNADQAITFEEFESVQLGATRDQVEERFGEALPRQQLVDEGILFDDPSAMGEDCLYYQSETPEFGEYYEFCFEGDELTIKNSL
jgi:hypothetical protein